MLTRMCTDIMPQGAILMQAWEDTTAPTQPLLKGWGKLGPKLSQFGKDPWKKVLQLNNPTQQTVSKIHLATVE